MSSSSSTPPQKYEVFLSFRGEDTRNNLVSHLYAALHQRGIRTFLDEENLESGQSISPELLKSIEESKFAIVVFSKNYASSTWCLDELVRIIECNSKNTLTVIPIFYHIDPSDIRKQNNSFAESFAKHEVNFKDNMEKVQIWRDNLREAANISGHDFSKSNVQEAPLIQKIVEEIFSKLPQKVSREGIFGIEHRVKELRTLLARKPNVVCFVGIWGMGGIGKTTTARVLFNELVHGFEGGCFLQDVCKKSMVDLQETLLLKVLRSLVILSDEYEGSNLIRDRFCSKRVLLVLDDVNNVNQLKSLARSDKWFGNGSRIIVTTRNKHLLNDVNELYKIEPLPENEAMQLFRWHAFKRSDPPKHLDQLSHCFVSYANGLPLALEILVSHLRGRQEDVWKSTFDKFKDDPDKEIITTLRISFDGLSHTQQNIFLDIACFFRGYYKDNKGLMYKVKVNKKLDSFGFHPVVGITDLIDKSLIHMSSSGEIQMHDLIQEMGRDIVRQKANKKPERYSRLWDSKDIIDVLTNNTGTNEVEALVLKDAHYLITLSEGAFRKMNMLRLLEITNCNLVISSNYLPNSLRWLYWSKYPGKSLPGYFQPRDLVSLNLSNSPTLETFPDISRMPNLEFLNLSQCRKLLEVPQYVAIHKKLIDLDLSFCDKLEKFPRTIQMESLKTLNLICCYGLQSLPDLPWSVRGLTSLQEITMFGGDDASRMLTLLLSLSSLKKIKMKECNVSEIILPKSIGCLTSLQELDLSWNSFTSLPESIICFSSLQVLRLSGSGIEELPQLSSSISELDLNECTELTRIQHLVDLLDKYENLSHLILVDCKQFATDQFLLGLWDWESLTNVLSKRQEVLQVLLPHIETFNSLYQKIASPAMVTLSPSWYNDKFRGFVIFVTGKRLQLELHAIDDLVTIMPHNYKYFSYSDEHTAFLYIPISKIKIGRYWNEQNDCCLLEVTNVGFVESWGIHLVYEDGVLNDLSDLISVIVGTGSFFSTMKICATPSDQIQ